jgi:uncharacterized protein (TIGR00299 family) protein
MRGLPVFSDGTEGELLTPTGAAILSTLAEGFGPMPSMVAEKVGYGAGSAERRLPNLLRLTLGSVAEPTESDAVAVLETAVDDMNPQIFGHLMDRLLAAGALDAFLTPVYMKKNRPGTLLTVLCPPADAQRLAVEILRESSSIGVRWRLEQRTKTERRMVEVLTPWGTVGVKEALLGGRVINVSPEYEDCRRAASAAGVPLKRVLASALAAAAEPDPHG